MQNKKHPLTINVSVVRLLFALSKALTISRSNSHFIATLLFFIFLEISTSSLAISSEDIKPRALAQVSRLTILTRLCLTASNVSQTGSFSFLDMMVL